MAGRPLLLITILLSGGCAALPSRGGRADSFGVTKCPPSAAGALLSPDALQCWFDAPHGHWRTLSTESHFDVLVVRVEAYDPRDGETIAQRFVAAHRAEFSEILLYVQPQRSSGAPMRRVRWTRDGGLSAFDIPEPVPHDVRPK